MMDTFDRLDIQELPIGSPLFRQEVEEFLSANGLRLEDVDVYCTIQSPDGHILAGGGIRKDVIKCVAVSEAARSGGLAAPLISRLIAIGAENGHTDLKVFTKPENRAVFESLGFHLLAEAPKAILMENSRGLEEYVSSLRRYAVSGRTGVIVMNANPFTLGHRYLVEQAAAQVDRLVVIPVREESSRFLYADRLDMIRKGCGELAMVPEGSDYQISAATFPTYFLKDLSDASETQMRLDLDLFGRHIAPALGATVRFVGSEPSDLMTARYNELMKECLPAYGVRVVEIPRLCDQEGAVSAARVRSVLDAGRASWELTPASSWPYLAAELMARALRTELDTPCKPGLVDPESRGGHSDMDYTLMSGSINVIRNSYLRHREMDVISLGKAVEADVLAFTGGVNTYRGAVFCQLLTVVAALGLRKEIPLSEPLEPARLSERIASLASRIPPSVTSHGGRAVKAYGVKGALQMACEGYLPLFRDWLPLYRSLAGDPWQKQKTLLGIMSSLDDTCLIHRAGFERARKVKEEALSLLQDFSEEKLKEMNVRFSAGGLSPGGCADMLALTVLVDSLIH